MYQYPGRLIVGIHAAVSMSFQLIPPNIATIMASVLEIECASVLENGCSCKA